MMARGSKAPSIGRIQKRKTNFSKSSLSACNARPVHAEGPGPEIAHVPCHRVVGSDGDLTGYYWGVERKRELIKKEATA
jgi:hypothetical protein